MVDAPLVVEDWERLTFRVNREAYRSADIFAQERANIWLHTWLYLGHETEIAAPNDFKARTIAGRPLIFCRDSAGEVHAFLNSCPHRGTILCREREGSTKHFQCFYHAWTFRNSGEVSSIPDVPPLLEHLGDAADYMTMIEQQHEGGMQTLPGVQLYSVLGNWKLAVENAMDGYHFSPNHNTFVGYLRESG